MTTEEVTLRAYFEQWLKLERDRAQAATERINSELQRIWDRFASLQVAVDKFEASNNERMRGANEFRDALKDQAARLATNTELAAVEKSLESRIDSAARTESERADALLKAKDAEHHAMTDRIGKLETAQAAAEVRRADQREAIGRRFAVWGAALGTIQVLLAILVFLLARMK